MKQRARALRRAGITLVEVVVALAIIAVLFGSMAVVTRTSERAYEQRSASSDVELRSGIALETLVGELELAILEDLAYDPAMPGELEYRRLVDVVGTDLIASPPRALRFELDPAEVDNGADDDGDGLIDEGQVVLVTDVGGASEQRRVIARNVAEFAEGEAPDGVDNDGNGLADEPGFFVVRDGGVLGVAVTFLKSVRASDEVVTRTARTSVMLRN